MNRIDMSIVFNDTHLLGIDVSHYEPALDWHQAKVGGVQWMYAKASEGTGITDQMLFKHVVGAQAEDILSTAYHFFHASESGIDQADYFLHAIQTLRLNLPCVFDWEDASKNGMSSEHQQEQALDWLNEVERESGKTPWIYMPWHLIPELNLSSDFARFPLLVQRYGANPTSEKPWPQMTAWQFSDAYAAPGLPSGHHCDANVFFGTIDQLRSYCK